MARKELFVAPAAGGKTDYALQLARTTAVSHHTVRICVPTALQARALRHRLATAGGALGVHILTFDKLVAACLDIAGEAYTLLSDPVLFRLLRTLIDQLPLNHYAPLKEKPGFVQVARQLIDELKAARVEPHAFATAVSNLGPELRLTELADIYTAYQNRLHTEQWADRIGLHWLAVEALAERAPDACRDWPLLIVDGFGDFTTAQLDLLALLADRVGHFVALLPRAEDTVYPRYERTITAVSNALDVLPQPLPVLPDANPAPAPLRHIARRLFAQSQSDDDQPLLVAGALTLREAPNYAAEARTALRWLKQRLVADGLDCHQVALLARNITPYRPFVTQIATEFGLPVRLANGRPLTQSPVVAALLALLRLHLPLDNHSSTAPHLPRRGVVAAWRSPYFRWQLPDGRYSTPAAADALDTLARRHRVICGRDQWQAAFATAARAAAHSGEPSEPDSEAVDEDAPPGAAVAELQTTFNHFLDLTQPPATATMRDFVRWLETLIGPDPQVVGDEEPDPASLHVTAQARAGSATAESDIAALRMLKDILRGLVWAETAVGDQDAAVSFPAFFAELSGAVQAASFTLPVTAGSEILVADATQARGLRFEAVALLGLGEGAFPATLREDPFLRDKDRAALREIYDFPLPPSTRSAEQELFYETVSRAGRQLLLTRPVLADNGADWVASPFWEAVRQLVTIEPVVIASEAVVAPAETASIAEWWETRAALAAPPAGAAATAVWDHITTAATIWLGRDSADQSPHDGNLAARTADLAHRFGPDHTWSVSRLEAYQTCGFLFFTQNVLGLQPRPEPAEGLDAGQLGRLYHRIFERAAPHVKEKMTEAEARTAVAAVAQPILDAAPETEGFRPTPWWSQTRREIVENVARSLALLAEGPYAFDQAEAAFGIYGPPLVVEANGDTLRLRGYIDRIDRQPNGRIRLIDYKLGSKAGYTPKKFTEGDRMQLPLYALAARETLALGAVADGFLWHFQQAEASHFTLEKIGVDDAIETAAAHAWRAVHHIRAGAFAPRPPEGGCPAYCPAAAFCWHYTPRPY